jgi:osmotically-inducible protein OsmY
MKYNLITLLMIFAVAGCSGASTSDSGAANNANGGAVARDNIGVNSRDRDGTTTTPIDQKENRADIDITANIRKRIVASKASVDAKNAKIMTRDGKVTLRGPVKTAEEKKQLEQIAADVAGAQNIDSQLEVKP